MTRACEAGDTSSRARASDAFYVGRRPEQTEAYVVTLCDVAPLRPRAHRDAPLEWGPDVDPGRIELAYAILRDVTRRQPSERLCAQFAREVVASLPHDGFVLHRDEIARWLAATRRDLDVAPRATRPSEPRFDGVITLMWRGFPLWL